MKRPICPFCKRQCSPSGGTLDGSEQYWTCWYCNYKVDDIEYTWLNENENVRRLGN